MKNVAQIVVGLPLEGPFDYKVPKDLEKETAVGRRVLVSFGRTHRVGYVVGLKSRSRWHKLKAISEVLDPHPVLDEAALALTKEFSIYNGCSWGEAIETYLPVRLRQPKPLDLPKFPGWGRETSLQKPEVVLLHDQGQAERWSYLISEIKKSTEQEKGIILLVPGVHFLQPVRDQIQARLSLEAVFLGKRLTPREEFDSWLKVKTGAVKLAVGLRSAVFAPFPRLGLIIILEEESETYKQDQSPFYHAREVAVMRSSQEGCSLILVSPTPSVESWYLAQRKKFKKVTLPPNHWAPLKIIDMTNYKSSSLMPSFPLRYQMEKTLEQKGKVMLYFNRRGFSSLTVCQQCEFTLRCNRCQVPLIYMFAKKKMVCRRCGKIEERPHLCPACQSRYLKAKGMGIEKLESEMARLFPQYRIARYDRETESLPRDANLWIATQAILNRPAIPPIDLIGVLHVDAELNRSDFRSGPKVFALLLRLSQLAREQVMVQTRLADHYCIKTAAQRDFRGFYTKEMKLRRELGLPPFRHWVALQLRGAKEEIVMEQADRLFHHLVDHLPKGFEITDPQPDWIPKLRGNYRFMILLKGQRVSSLVKFVKIHKNLWKRKRGIIVTLNVDP